MTGKHSHLNGVRSLNEDINASQDNVAKEFQKNGYETAIIGKWHLGNTKSELPQGFDYWNIFPCHGTYNDTVMIDNGTEVQYHGYVTETLTDLTLDWLD